MVFKESIFPFSNKYNACSTSQTVVSQVSSSLHRTILHILASKQSTMLLSAMSLLAQFELSFISSQLVIQQSIYPIDKSLFTQSVPIFLAQLMSIVPI